MKTVILRLQHFHFNLTFPDMSVRIATIRSLFEETRGRSERCSEHILAIAHVWMSQLTSWIKAPITRPAK